MAAFILVQALSGDIVSSAATVGVFLSGGFRLTAAMLPLQSALLNIKGYLPVAEKAHEILFDHSSSISKTKTLSTKEGGSEANLLMSPGRRTSSNRLEGSELGNSDLKIENPLAHNVQIIR